MSETLRALRLPGGSRAGYRGFFLLLQLAGPAFTTSLLTHVYELFICIAATELNK